MPRRWTRKRDRLTGPEGAALVRSCAALVKAEQSTPAARLNAARALRGRGLDFRWGTRGAARLASRILRHGLGYQPVRMGPFSLG